MPRIAIVVPDLSGGGGVPAVARFMVKVAMTSGRYSAKLISLPSSSGHPTNTTLRKPWTILQTARIRHETWEDHDFVTVGASCGELEFMRYMPRGPLRRELADCDLVQVVCGTPAWARSVERQGLPVSVHVATLTVVERKSRHLREKGLLAFWRRCMTIAANFCDTSGLQHANAIQVMNPWLLAHCRQMHEANPVIDIRYAPPGVDAHRFRPRTGPPSSSRLFVLCVGRLDDPRKNVHLLLRAFAAAAAQFPHLELVTAGAAAPPQTFYQEARALQIEERVRHVHRPDSDELIRLYQNASVFVSSSDEEGFGVAIVEAMSCSCPVVATRSGGPQGIITDGVDGLLVDTGDHLAIAHSITRLQEDPGFADRIAQAGRETVLKRFSDEAAGAVFIDIWDKLLGLEKPPGLR